MTTVRPMPGWSARYIGLPYQPGRFDCAHLVEKVQTEVFGRRVDLPKERPASQRSAEFAALVQETAPALAARLPDGQAPLEGDAALMIGAGRLNHVGVAVFEAGEWWVLHAFINARAVVLHRVRDLARNGLKLEGWYRWN